MGAKVVIIAIAFAQMAAGSLRYYHDKGRLTTAKDQPPRPTTVDDRNRVRCLRTSHVAPITSYNHARLEEYRDSVVVAYRLYNRIGLEHLKRLLAGVSHDAKILDVGGGTGRKAIPSAEDSFERITILDHAPEWLRLAEEKAKAAGVLSNPELVVGDVCDMPQVKDESYDYVFAMGGVVSYCGDPAAVIKEMSQVLKREGKLVADGIHNRLMSLHYLSHLGSLESLEEMVYNPGGKSRIAALMPEELEKIRVGKSASVA